MLDKETPTLLEVRGTVHEMVSYEDYEMLYNEYTKNDALLKEYRIRLRDCISKTS